MLPALQKGEPTWPELRSMGVAWWMRSTNKLRRCIEKVRAIVLSYSRFILIQNKNISSPVFFF